MLACIVKSQEKITGSTEISANVGQYLALNLSSDLSGGISFSSVTPGSQNNMATGNQGPDNCTKYWVGVDPSSNLNVNMWHKANQSMKYGINEISIGNLTHEANKTSNGANVDMDLWSDGRYPLSLQYMPIGGTPEPCHDLAPGEACFIAFWLDVPGGVPSGNYKSYYWYCANATSGSTSCE
ncbi:MAG: hypothetical protein QXS48_04355 [Candidatus Aenigmatarchaeota archaeon]